MPDLLPPGAPSLASVFFGTVQDLRARSHLLASAYEVTQAAGLVRRLLADQKALLASMTKNFPAVKVEFKVGNLWVQLEGKSDRIWLQGPWLDNQLVAMNDERQGLPAGSDGQFLSMDGFLAHEVAEKVVRGGPIVTATVKDLVRLYANLFGGVHVGMETKPNPLLLEVAELEEPFSRETMAAVGRTVARALEPLANLALMEGRKYPYGLDVPVPLGQPSAEGA